jgi:hypothetical protein
MLNNCLFLFFSHTYEVAPVFVLVECAVLRHVLNIFGLQNGDGIFAPGNLVIWLKKHMPMIHFTVITMETVRSVSYI